MQHINNDAVCVFFFFFFFFCVLFVAVFCYCCCFCGLVPVHNTHIRSALPDRYFAIANESTLGNEGSVAQRAILLTWINLNHSMDEKSPPSKIWDEIFYPFPNFKGCTIEV